MRWEIAMDHFQLMDGELHCEDVPLAEIAAAVGTPVYVYSTATMCRHVAALRLALEGLPDPLIAYAVKANPNSAVIATLAKAGLGARMLLQVHDELVFEAVDAEVEAVKKVVKDVMEKAPEPAIKLAVPLQVDARAADNWEEAH